MIINRNNTVLFSLKPYLFLLVLMPLFFHSSLYAKGKKQRKEQKWKLEVGQAFIYDSNILKYSEKYINRFKNGINNGRFHINTYDDLSLYSSLRISYRFRIFGKLKTRISGNASRRTYIVNNIKTWSQIGIGFQQYFTKKASFKLFYSYIPEFYVRHFRDEDWVEVYGYTPETFQPFSFSKNHYGFWVQNTFSRATKLRASVTYAQYYHNQHYTEYDSKNLTLGLSIYQRINKLFEVMCAYQFITSRAKAYDVATETIDNSTHADASYEEDKFFLGFKVRLPEVLKRKNNFHLRASYGKRYYSSKRYLELDRLHAGRVDDNLRIYATYNLMVLNNLKVSTYYYWFQRSSFTSAELNKNYLSNEKNYHQYQIGFEIVYNLKI